MARKKKGGIQHWKHGWIPLSAAAKAFVAGKGPKPGGGGGSSPAARALANANSPGAGTLGGSRKRQRTPADVAALAGANLPGSMAFSRPQKANAGRPAPTPVRVAGDAPWKPPPKGVVAFESRPGYKRDRPKPSTNVRMASTVGFSTMTPEQKERVKKAALKRNPKGNGTAPHGTGPKDFNTGFGLAMAMSSGSAYPPHDDPLTSSMQDNPLLGGSIGGTYMPDFKGQSFVDWKAVHGEDFQKNQELMHQFIDGQMSLEEFDAKNPMRGPVIFPADSKGNPDLLDAIKTNGGFTYDPRTGGLLKEGEAQGYAIALPGTEQIVGHEQVNGEHITREAFAQGIAAVIMQNKEKFAQGAVIGGWYSPERNEYMVEMSQIVPPDRDLAVAIGKERNQEAIYNLGTGEIVVTGNMTWDPKGAEDKIAKFDVDLTPEERAAAKYYTGPGFAPLNKSLRAGTPPPPSVGFYELQLDNALSKSKTVAPVTAYRGVSSGPWLPDHLAPGAIWTESGYVSTAVSVGPPPDYEGDVQMSINIPAGANALDLDAFGLSHHSEEAELLLPHGSQFRVVSDVVGEDGKRQLSMDLIISGISG